MNKWLIIFPILSVICVMSAYWYATSENEKTLVSTTSNDTSGTINITGDWDITVFNSDGTIAESLEFQNHFIGERLLTNLLVGDRKVEDQYIVIFSEGYWEMSCEEQELFIPIPTNHPQTTLLDINHWTHFLPTEVNIELDDLSGTAPNAFKLSAACTVKYKFENASPKITALRTAFGWDAVGTDMFVPPEDYAINYLTSYPLDLDVSHNQKVAFNVRISYE